MLNLAAYHFTPLDDPRGLAGRLRQAATEAGLKGTILVAPEGINLFLAGEDAAVRGLVDLLRSLPGLQGLQPKYSHSSRIPFARLKVKLKPVIIRFGHPHATPLASGERAPAVQPRTLARWLGQGGRDDQGRPLVLLALTFILPLLFMLFSSLKPKDQILSDLTTFRAFLPVGDLSLDNYVGVFNRVPVARFFLNSIIVTTTIVVLGLVVNSMAGFAIARLNFRGKKILLGAIIATLIVPFETFAIPMVYLISKLPRIGFYPDGVALDWGWNNSFEVLIIPFIANAFSIFLFTQYYSSIPKELDEAARVDGAGWFKIYWKVVSPLAMPAFATSAILTFLPQWNSYLWPLLVIQQEELRPVQVGLRYFFASGTAEGTPWGQIMAYTSLITIPVIIVFLMFQRAFISSIASSGVKG